ncbi:helix-turn-helix domain-containing protein, partial [Streptomyces sp. ET3-23]|uniref:helix-turn-helix domain-containing protein n=1 Tax=Streptomyces sp. ET3-23 TaxID=2885643 RepID=UPI001D0F7B0F
CDAPNIRWVSKYLVVMSHSGPSAVAIVLSEAERAELVRRTKMPHRRSAEKARIILACADGMSNTGVARLVGVQSKTVGKWRRAFAFERMAGFEDAGWIGRPKADLILDDAERRQLQQWARQAKTAQFLALRAKIVLRCAEGGTNQQAAADLGIDRSTVDRWRSMDRLGDTRRFMGVGPSVRTLVVQYETLLVFFAPPFGCDRRDCAEVATLRRGAGGRRVTWVIGLAPFWRPPVLGPKAPLGAIPRSLCAFNQRVGSASGVGTRVAWMSSPRLGPALILARPGPDHWGGLQAWQEGAAEAVGEPRCNG